MADYSQHEVNNLRQYKQELIACIAFYTLVLIGSIWLAKRIDEGSLRTLIVLLPVLPAMGLIWVVLRYLRRLDDYLRQMCLEILAMAGGFTALLAFSYGFLEGLGFPRLSGFIYYGVFMSSWLLLSLWRNFRERA